MPVNPSSIQGTLSGAELLTELTNIHLVKYESVPAPTISIVGDMLNITDPLGLAETFIVYANGKEVHTVTAAYDGPEYSGQ